MIKLPFATFHIKSLSKAFEYFGVILKIYFSKYYRLYSFKIAFTATMSSFFMIAGFISAVRGVQFLSDKEAVQILTFQFSASELYIPCGVVVFIFFALNGELKYMSEKYIEEFKLAARRNVLNACLNNLDIVGKHSDPPFQNPIFLSDVPSERTRALALLNSSVHRASLGLTNVIPSVFMMSLVGVVMLILSKWITLGIFIGVIPIALYLIFSVRKNDESKLSDKKTLEDYNFGVKDFFNQKVSRETLFKVVNEEFKRSERIRLDVCKREYLQSYWANVSLFFVVAAGLYALKNGVMDIGSLILYILSIRWFISSTLRTLNNTHTIGLSREGCYYISWSMKG